MRNVGTDVTLDKIILTVGELPASPAVISAIIGLTSNLDSKIIDIAKILKADQSLAAKVLRLSNSSFYGRSTEVKSLNEAILVLGFSAVCSMVIATLTHSMYDTEDQDGPEMKLWRHSLSTAVAARQIGKRIGHPDKEEIFIAALLHDIGKLVLLQQIPKQYREVIGEVEESACSFAGVESKMLGFDHCDVASLLLSKWLFPKSLTHAISRHHQPQAGIDGQPAPIAQVVNLANHAAKSLDVGFADGKIERLADLKSAQAMSLNEETLSEILEEVKKFYLAEIAIIEEAGQ